MQKGIMRKRRASPLSEYGKQLQAKQALKKEYDLRERQFKGYVGKVLAKKHQGVDTSEFLLQKLETRLDGVVFRMGFAQTRAQARQLVGHGHIMVNGKVMNVPSYQVQKGQIISVKPVSLEKTNIKNTKLSLKKFQPPSWVELDKENMSGTVKDFPKLQEVRSEVDIPLVFEFYSR
ncbi:MAG: 30S ribosomal protein S4 [Candidatus Wildermuthbacteria bacterium]|nr:30S ribosomal protein S4 [Candidatus Wildermuthbacteria bacterium]